MSSTSRTRSERGWWPIATNTPVTGRVVSSPLTVLRTRSPGTLFVAFDLGNDGVGQEADLLVAAGPVEHDLRGAELVATVHQRHAAGEPGQESGLFHRRVAAADHRDVLVLKKKPSQVAHALTPRPSSLSSPGTPRYRAAAPIARITARA